MRCVACAWGAGVRVLRAAGLALVLGMVALASAQTPRAATVQLNDAAGTIEAEVLEVCGDAVKIRAHWGKVLHTA